MLSANNQGHHRLMTQPGKLGSARCQRDLVCTPWTSVQCTSHASVFQFSPRVECFPSQLEQDIAGANTHEEIGTDLRNLSDPYDLAAFKASLKIADARNEILVRMCENRTGDALKYIGTASVVRDIDRLATELEGEGAATNYWGLSYGTVIGSYLVNM